MVTTVLFVVGLVLLVLGAGWLVTGASRLAAAVGLSPLVIGLTVVAFGTSAPELAVSLQSALSGQADVALGNVVGSNICNVLLILGVSAAIAPLAVTQRLVRLDVPLVIGATIVVFVMALDGRVSRLDGAVLFLGVVGYTAFAVVKGRDEAPEVVREYADEYGPPPAAAGGRAWVGNVVRAVVGLGMLVLGARLVVDGAVAVARYVGLSELMIGLTVVAVGTSLPELATSVMASLRGERDIAVGNVIGSNLFNLLAVLGTTAAASPGGVGVPDAALAFDLPILLATSVACLPILLTGHRIDRWEGVLFLGGYAAYVTWLVLDATGHAFLPAFRAAMLFFVLPLVALTLAVSLHRHRRRTRAG